MENEPAQIEVAQTSAPEIDTSQFVSKEDYDALFSLVKELKDGEEAKKDKVLSEKRLKLTELTGEDEAEYISFGEEALDKMIKFASKSKKNVPEELGFVEGGNDRVVKQKATPVIQKEALRLILNIPETSAKVDKHYGAYNAGRALNVYDRVGKELEAKFSEGDN
jgi:SPX domain protein involved in polyphosphate accumulation